MHHTVVGFAELVASDPVFSPPPGYCRPTPSGGDAEAAEQERTRIVRRAWQVHLAAYPLHAVRAAVRAADARDVAAFLLVTLDLMRRRELFIWQIAKEQRRRGCQVALLALDRLLPELPERRSIQDARRALSGAAETGALADADWRALADLETVPALLPEPPKAKERWTSPILKVAPAGETRRTPRQRERARPGETPTWLPVAVNLLIEGLSDAKIAQRVGVAKSTLSESRLWRETKAIRARGRPAAPEYRRQRSAQEALPNGEPNDEPN